MNQIICGKKDEIKIQLHFFILKLFYLFHFYSFLNLLLYHQVLPVQFELKY